MKFSEETMKEKSKSFFDPNQNKKISKMDETIIQELLKAVKPLDKNSEKTKIVQHIESYFCHSKTINLLKNNGVIDDSE